MWKRWAFSWRHGVQYCWPAFQRVVSCYSWWWLRDVNHVVLLTLMLPFQYSLKVIVCKSLYVWSPCACGCTSCEHHWSTDMPSVCAISLYRLMTTVMCILVANSEGLLVYQLRQWRNVTDSWWWTVNSSDFMFSFVPVSLCVTQYFEFWRKCLLCTKLKVRVRWLCQQLSLFCAVCRLLKLPPLEVPPTAFWPMTLTTLTFDPSWAMIMIHACIKIKVKGRSKYSETDRQMDEPINYIIFCDNAVD